MRVMCLAAIVLSVASTLPAKDLFVNNVGGDDRRSGTSTEPEGIMGGPCKTIRRALQLAENGDRIILAKTEEPYRESITFQAEHNSGVAERPFQLIGNGAILDGTQEVSVRAWEAMGQAEFRFRPRNLNHHLLYLDGQPAVRVAADRNAPRPLLEPRQWCTWDHFVFFRTDNDRLLKDYRLTFTALPVGITLYDVQHVIIRDLVIQGFQLDGVNAHDDAVRVSLFGVTIRGNGRSGVSIGGSSQLRMEGCVADSNGKAQVRVEGNSRTQIVDCELNETTAPAITRDGGYVSRTPQPAANR